MSQLTGNYAGTPFADTIAGFINLASSTDLSGAAIANARVTGRCGNDVIRGIATITAPGGEVAGVVSSWVDAGADDDILEFSAVFRPVASSHINPTASYGVKWATILGGSGSDTLLIESENSGFSDGMRSAYGIYQSTVDMGDDDDAVTVRARSGFSGLGRDTGAAYGLYQSTLRGGDGNDNLAIVSDSSGYLGAMRSYGSYQSLIDAGSGDDVINLSVYAGARGGGVAYGVLETTVLGGSGRDDLTITSYAAAMAGSRSYAAAFSLIDGGTGDDRMVLSSTASGTAHTQGYGLFNSRLLGGDGNDDITISGITSSGYDGQGIGVYRGTVDGGNGNDTITITGESLHDSPTNAGYGLLQASVYGGAGDDVITIRGTTLSFKDSLIHGGLGNDRFDVGIGHGTVDGGFGCDLIVLDFFTPQTMTVQALTNNGLRITGTVDGQGNSLSWSQTIVNMEQFQVGSHLFSTNHDVASYLRSLT